MIQANKLKGKQRGSILVFALAVTGLIMILLVVALELVHAEAYAARKSLNNKQALNLAEAGVDRAIRRLNSDSTYAGEVDTPLGGGVFSISVSGVGSIRTIESTGYVPNRINPLAIKTVKVEASLNSQNVEFFYGVQVDAGGMTIGNNAQVTGNVYSNGNIIGQNGAKITGDATVAGGLSDNPSVEATTHDADHYFAVNSTNRDIAQSFTAPSNEALNKVSIFIGKVGNPTSNLTVRIHANNSNSPTSTTLASAVIPHSSVGLTPSWIDATFSSPATLIAGNKYWIVLDYGSSSNVDYWNWRKDSNDGYGNNTGKFTSNCCSGNPTWTEIGGDLAFRAWLGGNVTRIDNVIIGDNTSGSGRANLFVNTTIHGSSCPNDYCIIENPNPEVLPISDGVVTDWKNTAAAGGTYIGDYSLINGQIGSLGPKKIQGNLTVDNNAQLTITGSLWVTGNITISNGATIQLDLGYGQNSGMVIADGTILVSNNSQFLGTGDGSYVLLLTTRDAKNETSITIDNNSNGVIYYAGKSRIQFANNAIAKEATAWGIDLSNNAVISYDSGLSNTTFTGGPGGGWAVKKGTWRQTN